MLNINSYYNLYNPNYYFPFEKETRNNDFYYKLMTMDCSMTWSDVSQSHSNIYEYNFEMEKNKLYYYLTTYGFYSKVDNFVHTSFKRENCGLIIYNGEKSQNRPLLVISDMPHIPTSDHTSYIYPIIYDENNDQGILIELNLYDMVDLTSSEYMLYNITYYLSTNDKRIVYAYSSNNYFKLFLDKDYYKSFLSNSGFAVLHVELKKEFPNKKYYASINFVSSKISPEYISSNRTYQLTLRRSSSKYYYSQVSKNKNGYIKLTFPKNYATPQNVTIYSKIVKKNEIEKDYNWNKRVKLPEKDDENLLKINNSLVYYNENDTEKCDEGCEIYFHIKNLKNSEAFFNITFHDGEYKEDSDEENDDKDNGNKNDNLWLKIFIPVFIVCVIIIVVIVVLILVRKKKNADINTKEIDAIEEGLLQPN